MSIVVVGAGAIGLLVGGRLSQAGRTVALLARPSLAEALAAAPARIRDGAEVTTAADLIALTDPSEIPDHAQPVELAILAVKGYDTPASIATLVALRPSAVLSLQNGLGNEELLADALGPERIIAGAITIAVEVEGPGSVVVAKHGGIGLAPVAPGAPVEQAAEHLRAAGFDVDVQADYRALKWSKTLLNILGNATAAILDMPVEAVFAEPRLARLERQAFLEALAVMASLSVRPLNLPGTPAATLALAMRYAPAWLLYPLLRRAVARGRGGKPPSLQLDLARGRERSEARQLYGAIAEHAARVGVPAPVNRALWETVRSIAAGELPWESFRGKPERLLEQVRRQGTS